MADGGISMYRERGIECTGCIEGTYVDPVRMAAAISFCIESRATSTTGGTWDWQHIWKINQYRSPLPLGGSRFSDLISFWTSRHLFLRSRCRLLMTLNSLSIQNNNWRCTNSCCVRCRGGLFMMNKAKKRGCLNFNSEKLAFLRGQLFLFACNAHPDP